MNTITILLLLLGLHIAVTERIRPAIRSLAAPGDPARPCLPDSRRAGPRVARRRAGPCDRRRQERRDPPDPNPRHEAAGYRAGVRITPLDEDRHPADRRADPCGFRRVRPVRAFRPGPSGRRCGPHAPFFRAPDDDQQRVKAVSQVIGFVVLENGIFLFAVSGASPTSTRSPRRAPSTAPSSTISTRSA